MKQTAVEWLIDMLKQQGLLIGEPDNLITVKEANKMFEQQIIDAYNNGDLRSADLYYNETFKQ